MSVDLGVKRLLEKFGDRIVGVVLFRSRGRGGYNRRSDYDFPVVVRNWPEKFKRKKQIYLALKEKISLDVTVIDVDEEVLFRENMEVDYFLLNIVEDGKILFQF